MPVNGLALDIVAVNDITDTKILASLLKHDSTYGVYNRHVEVGRNSTMVDDKRIMTLSDRSPKNLPWGDLEVDIVIGIKRGIDDYSSRIHKRSGTC